MIRRHRSINYLILSALLAMCFSIALPAHAVQEIYWVKAYPQSAFINTPSTVNIMAQFAYDANLIRTGVSLIKVDQAGKQLAVLGILYDDGTHGDDTAGDNIFTGQVSVSEVQPTYLYYRVSAAYKGTLKRLVSDTLTVPVKTTVGPEEVRASVVESLTQGNVAAAKAQFNPGEKTDMLDSIPLEKQELLRDWIRNAVLIKDMPSMRVYVTRWVDTEGINHETKFMMMPNGLGEWKIVW